MKRAQLHPSADRELHEAARYLEHERTGYGDRFLTAFTAARDFVQRFPDAGRRTIADCRYVPIHGFRHDLVYQQHQGRIVIIAIAHHRRQEGYWASRIR